MNTPPEHLRAIANLESVGCKWEADVLRRLHAANLDCVDHFNAIKADRDELLAALLKIKYLANNPGDASLALSRIDNTCANALEKAYA